MSAHTTTLIAGVRLTNRKVIGPRTFYNHSTGESYEKNITEWEMISESGVVFKDPTTNIDLTDQQVYDWMNPEAGDFGLVGQVGDVLALGVVIGHHNPCYDAQLETFDLDTIESHMQKARERLESIGIRDHVRMFMVSDYTGIDTF